LGIRYWELGLSNTSLAQILNQKVIRLYENIYFSDQAINTQSALLYYMERDKQYNDQDPHQGGDE
jgi:hypothetical protein